MRSIWDILQGPRVNDSIVRISALDWGRSCGVVTPVSSYKMVSALISRGNNSAGQQAIEKWVVRKLRDIHLDGMTGI